MRKPSHGRLGARSDSRLLVEYASDTRATTQETASGRGHAGFANKTLVLTLLEVDPTGKSALEVGTVSLNLAEFANNANPLAPRAQREFSVVALPAIVGASRAPQ